MLSAPDCRPFSSFFRRNPPAPSFSRKKQPIRPPSAHAPSPPDLPRFCPICTNGTFRKFPTIPPVENVDNSPRGTACRAFFPGFWGCDKESYQQFRQPRLWETFSPESTNFDTFSLDSQSFAPLPLRRRRCTPIPPSQFLRHQSASPLSPRQPPRGRSGGDKPPLPAGDGHIPHILLCPLFRSRPPAPRSVKILHTLRRSIH